MSLPEQLDQTRLAAFLEEELRQLHIQLLRRLETTDLKEIIKRKNPYLFRFKRHRSLAELAKALADATLSASEETYFGRFLEATAIHVCATAYDGQKSSAEGIDLEFTREGKRYIVAIKSGPNWGNSDQKKKMRDNFRAAKQRIRQGAARQEVVSVNGCCYGKTPKKPDKGDYYLLCGQDFWELISGDAEIYRTVFDLIGQTADAINGSFEEQYEQTVARLTEDLQQAFTDEQSALDWNRILAYNSSNPR